MLRPLVLLTATIPLAALHAAEAGKVVYVAGQAQVAGAAARQGDPVRDGDLVRTEDDGYLYIRTADQGVLIVRPGTEARLVRDLAGTGAGMRLEAAQGAAGNLDTRKNGALHANLPALAANGAVHPPELVERAQVVSWGRWAAVAGQAPNATLAQAGARPLAANEVYVLFRSDDGAPYVTPARGNAGFALASAEAYVRDADTGQRTAASVSGGRLDVDFSRATFATSLDVRDQGSAYQLAGAGTLAKDGQFGTAAALTRPGAMQVNGALDGNGGASYLFEGTLTPRRVLSGVTVWRAGAVR